MAEVLPAREAEEAEVQCYMSAHYGKEQHMASDSIDRRSKMEPKEDSAEEKRTAYDCGRKRLQNEGAATGINVGQKE